MKAIKCYVMFFWSVRSFTGRKVLDHHSFSVEEDGLELNIHLNAILSVLNVNVLDLNVHDLTLIGTEVVVNHRLPWWLAVGIALAGIVVSGHRKACSGIVPEGGSGALRQEEGAVCIVVWMPLKHINEIGCQVGVAES